jgi:O-phospho-L-seryl-tRNASec:L-selenocysteinyl-tRNA synthase
VTSPSDSVIQNIGKIYAGRASSSPIIDLFITLLSMGFKGYERLLKERNELAQAFPVRLQSVAQKHGERLLVCPENSISFGITLDKLVRPREEDEDENDYLKLVSKDISSFGAILFSRCISGTRVVPRGDTKMMDKIKFKGFGSSTNDYPHAYMTAACAIGVRPVELDEFFARLDKAFTQYKKRSSSA